MSRRAVCEKHKHGSVRGALRNGGAYSTGVGGVRTPRRGLDKLNADGVCDGRSALRNVMNGQVERGSQKLFLALNPFSGVLGGGAPQS